MTDIGFDIISDLNLRPDDSFDWENKVTSLYCIVAGNISSDIRTVLQVLLHLSTKYQGVFYVPGKLEYETADVLSERTNNLHAVIEEIPNVVILYQSVIVVDGIAILGSNGWGNIEHAIDTKNMKMTAAKYQDFTYLTECLTKLQKHIDVKKIVVVTNAVPHESLYFGEMPYNVVDQIPLNEILNADTEQKVSHWIFGTYDKPVDITLGNIQYISNPYNDFGPYHAKRLEISL